MDTIQLDRHPAVRPAADEPRLPPLGRELNVLLVWPRFAASFWSLSGIMELLPQECSHPPLGLITVAALCPRGWTLRLIDRSCQPMTDADLRAADLVMLSGMREQHDDMLAVLARARALRLREEPARARRRDTPRRDRTLGVRVSRVRISIGRGSRSGTVHQPTRDVSPRNRREKRVPSR